jgi:hypothetical protein
VDSSAVGKEAVLGGSSSTIKDLIEKFINENVQGILRPRVLSIVEEVFALVELSESLMPQKMSAEACTAKLNAMGVSPTTCSKAQALGWYPGELLDFIEKWASQVPQITSIVEEIFSLFSIVPTPVAPTVPPAA